MFLPPVRLSSLPFPEIDVFRRWPVAGPVSGVWWRVGWPVAGARCPVARVRWPVFGGVAGGRWPARRSCGSAIRLYHNYDDDDEDDDEDDDDEDDNNDFSNYEFCGLGACALDIEHERAHGLGMDALVIGCSRTSTLLWFRHGCSGHRMQSSMNVIIV